MPTISVLVASYNYEHYLGQTIESILKQTFEDFEILVIDDGSTDNSAALAQRYAAEDSRVRVLLHPDGRNHGLPATLALGIREAKGVYTAFLESDDLWLPQNLEQKLSAARSSTAGAVFNAIDPLPMPNADTEWFDSYVPRIMKEHTARTARPEQPFSLVNGLITENKIPTFSCIMVETALLRQCSMDAPVPRWLDWWLWSQIARMTRFCFVPQPLTLWRLHAGSFNHKISFRRYMADSKAIWGGFRAAFLKTDWNAGRRLPAMLFFCPFWFRLLLRFCMIARSSGIRETLRKIHNRLH